MDTKRAILLSKFLSMVLRHSPAQFGLTLEAGGWVAVADLIEAADRHGFRFSLQELSEVVATSDKQRFAWDDSGTRIRATQGHTTAVEMTFDRGIPPPVLYHGTADRNVDSILLTGLMKMLRHHVHLSMDAESAKHVGSRHGKPVVLAVASGRMADSRFEFFLSANGVWLVDHVPPEFLSVVRHE